MNKKIVIISGGELEEEFVLSILEKEENQYVIGVDKGMEFLYSHQILPNYIVGDFDSVKKEIGDYYRNETDVPIREFNPVKDASDTEIAIRLAMTLGAGEILILGATGGRIDHLWANVQSLFTDLGGWLKSIQVYGTAKNVFTITGYKGLDPEVNLGGLQPGLDLRETFYPHTRSFIFGVKVNF